MRLDPVIEQQVARWAASHHGYLHRRELLAMGHTPDTLKARWRSGQLERVTTRVSRVPGAPRTPVGELYAAVLDGPPGTRASSLSACALYSWRAHPALPHVTVPYGGNTRLVAAVHRSAIDPVDATVVGVVPATTPARTLVDVAAVLAADELAELVDLAITSGTVRRSAVEACIDRLTVRPGRKGIPNLRDALAIWQPGIERDSVAEARLFRLLVAWGFPPPLPLYVIRDENGLAVCEVDAAWPDRRVGLEYDSEAHHGPRRWAADERRAAGARALGWTIIPVDKTDVRPGGHDRLRSLLRDLLGAPRHSRAS